MCRNTPLYEASRGFSATTELLSLNAAVRSALFCCVDSFSAAPRPIPKPNPEAETAVDQGQSPITSPAAEPQPVPVVVEYSSRPVPPTPDEQQEEAPEASYEIDVYQELDPQDK